MPFTSVSADHFEKYTQRMAGGMADKLFFAEHVHADVYVDFGCADGTLLRNLKMLQPEARMIGYDLSELATTRAAQAVDGEFFHDWDALTTHLAQFKGKSIALIASSVIHEVYSYGGALAARQFWTNLREGPFTHFILRDMAISHEDIWKNENILAHKVRRQANPDLLADFENIWGSINYRHRLVHFLLKYRYDDNWEREVNEDYLPATKEDLLRVTSPAFEVKMMSHETVPFLEDRLKEDFGISFPCPTHLKLILSRR